MTIYEKLSFDFIGRVFMTVIGGEIFYDKRMNLIVYEKHSFDFIDTVS
jgi:hypothetical protein